MKLRTLELMFLMALLSHAHAAFAAEKRHRRRHPPIQVLEVARPPDVPPGASELCTQVLVQHVFGNSIDEAPVVRPYSPSPSCPAHRWSRVVLRWTASSTGRQFDRISAVWLGGVEILRTCTAEPVQQPGGIEWTVEKDVTRYSSLWKRPQMVALQLANVLSAADSLTGLYDVTLSVHFYDAPRDAATEAAPPRTTSETLEPLRSGARTAKFRNPKSSGGAAGKAEMVSSLFKSSGDGEDRVSAPDVIFPFPSSSSDHWFRIRDEHDAQTRRIPPIPRNAYRAAIELCVSSHGRDEFWYANKPNEYFTSNNFTTPAAFENGPFREILVTIDDLLAGVVHPFPVIYTGGVNPFFWRPVTSIGSFILPSYDLDITPFLARLLNPKPHIFTLAIPNALPFWLLGLNLHIWVDPESSTTHGALLHHSTSITTSTENLNFQALDGTFQFQTARVLSHAGWLLSSFGNVTTHVETAAKFTHAMAVSDSGNGIRIHQGSVTERTVRVKSDEQAIAYGHERFSFPLQMAVGQVVYREGGLVQKAAIDHAWEEERQCQSRGKSNSSLGYGVGSFFSAMKNRQRARGRLLVPVTGEARGVAETRQRLAYDGSRGCYFRELEVGNNGSYVFDHSHTRCI